MLAPSETIDGGFADPVFDAQAVFKAVMDAMARPGHDDRRSSRSAAPPPPLSPTAACGRADALRHDTPLWLDPALQASAAVALLSRLPHRRAAGEHAVATRRSRWFRARPS